MSILIRGFASLTPGYSPWPLQGQEISELTKRGGTSGARLVCVAPETGCLPFEHVMEIIISNHMQLPSNQ